MGGIRSHLRGLLQRRARWALVGVVLAAVGATVWPGTGLRDTNHDAASDESADTVEVPSLVEGVDPLVVDVSDGDEGEAEATETTGRLDVAGVSFLDEPVDRRSVYAGRAVTGEVTVAAVSEAGVWVDAAEDPLLVAWGDVDGVPAVSVGDEIAVQGVVRRVTEHDVGLLGTFGSDPDRVSVGDGYVWALEVGS